MKTRRLLTDTFRGRANGSVQFLAGSALALGSAAGAGLVELVGVDLTITACAAATLTASIWVLATGTWSADTNAAPGSGR